MNNSKASKNVGVFNRFLWFVAGVDIETLAMCPFDHKKYEAIGMTILMTSLVGFASGSSAAWYFTADGLWTLIFGVFWSILIFSIDRSLVVTLKKDPYKNNIHSYIVPLISRGVMAVLVAGIMSIPLELLVFNGFIQNDLESYKSDLKRQQHDDSFDIQQASEYATQSQALGETLAQNGKSIGEIRDRLNGKSSERQSERNKMNSPNTMAYTSASSSVQNLHRQLNVLNTLPVQDERRKQIPELQNKIKNYQHVLATERNAWNQKVSARIAELDQEIATIESSLKVAESAYEKTNQEMIRVDSTARSYQTRAEVSLGRTENSLNNGNNFTLYYSVLQHALSKKHTVMHEVTGSDGKKKTIEEEEYVNKDFIILLWLIRALFFVIEILPTVVKIASNPGSYECRVFHEEQEMKKYLQSQEYKDYCHEMFHGSHRLEQEIQHERQEAEKAVQKRIIQSIIDAQETVAQDCIDNWEKIEKAKLRRQSIAV